MLGSTPKNWKCPHCGLPQVATAENRHHGVFEIDIGEHKHQSAKLRFEGVACLNPDCREVTLRVDLLCSRVIAGKRQIQVLDSVRLRPFGAERPLPDCVPAPLREDYREACLILELSPKSAATLARRILQGMIRDFCGIKKARLIDEVKELRKRVDEGDAPKGVTHDSVDAIDSVREIGNIGAHMEKDINLVVDIDPDEARLLIGLVETLFEDWYIERQRREDRFAEIARVRSEKKAAKAAPAPDGVNALLTIAKGSG